MTPQIDRPQVIPLAAWLIAGLVCALAAAGFFFFLGGPVSADGLGSYWFYLWLLPVLALLAAWVLAIGYVYGDARRRGMRYAMWTLLAIFIPNGIGIVLYFILREPMPVHCSRCGCAANPKFAYCPNCGNNILPACKGCGKTLERGWSHCAWCGSKV